MVKRYILHVLIFIISIPALAQRPKPAALSLPPADTIYFDRDWTRTQTLEEVAYARIAHRTPDGKIVGTVRDYFYPSWKKQGEGKLLSESPDVLSGLCTGWNENGKMSFHGTFVNGQRQADFQSWREDGREIKCGYVTQDALPLSKATLHCSTCMYLSRKVFEVDVPAGTVGIVYKLDVRDEDEQSISWSTALSLAGSLSNPGTAPMAILSMFTSSLNKQTAGSQTTKTTKCRWYITADAEAAQQFYDTKGFITKPSVCYRVEENTPTETAPLALPAGTRRLFVCVNNDNIRTDATATLSVTALVQACN
ncbi:hypothetical protein GCM10023172_42510 [Hymenobacter ginsengisoli]|uniref:MORN repeat-containing protein n=1 Tax=Hymenobacter ginsengisoli TaxID=1051626 RepID=A0ABP8QTI3_9BACT|nr:MULTISPECIES: hypothetical protein [unclassified Hymenobacter]MBO2033410.1 hypothetical protein [Hymenobacter sp. BT559]